MNLILFGPQGSGKGTQSSLLVERLSYRHISTGDLLRAAIKNQTELGQKAQVFMDQGALVPDEIVVGMVEETLKSLPAGQPFILDGFPRTLAQAEALDQMLKKNQLNVGRAISLEVPRQELMGRLTGRRVCKNCGTVYHVQSKPPRQEGVCDKCGGSVVQRDDDRAEAIETRLNIYDQSTAPLKDYYRRQDKLIEIDGNQSAEAVYKKLTGFLG